VDYQQVSGPGGLTVDVPAGWVLTGSPSVDNEQADDPADAQRFVRFGASTPAKASQRDEILAGERTNPNIQRGYHRVQLTSLTFQGGDAVDWEFTFSKAGVTRHARGLYWRANGLGYVVYVSGPDSAWAPLQPVFDRMVASVITH